MGYLRGRNGAIRSGHHVLVRAGRVVVDRGEVVDTDPRTGVAVIQGRDGGLHTYKASQLSRVGEVDFR